MKALLAISLIIPLPAFAQSFHGYSCTQDCSGHQAGYRWAIQHGVDDASDCRGNSQSFIEGCRAAVEESSEADDHNEEAE